MPLDAAGEQQRMGMARLFFQAPAFGVLDECTNATSVDVEEGLYAHAESLGITLLTITQRTALVRFWLPPTGSESTVIAKDALGDLARGCAAPSASKRP